MNHHTPYPIRLSVACYRVLLNAYPSAHRRVYGPLMQQLFHDLCRDAYQQNGLWSLTRFWMWTLFDFILSVGTTYREAIEAIMTIKHTFTPMPWRYILLVVLPGLLFGISRFYYPFYLPFQISFILILLLTFATLVKQKRIPGWGLLMIGLMLSWGAMVVIIIGGEWLARLLHYNGELQRLLMAIPLWAVIGMLGWQYWQVWRSFSRIFVLILLVIVIAALFVGMDALTTAAYMLLPVAIGLPLARRHGTQAILFVVGAYCWWLFDSDYISGWLINDLPFYAAYAVLMRLLFMSVGPLLLLRAQSLQGQVAGLLTPMAVVLVARVLVPWLVSPSSHPARIWWGDVLLSVFTLLAFSLAFALYTRVDRTESPITPQGTEQPVYAG